MGRTQRIAGYGHTQSIKAIVKTSYDESDHKTKIIELSKKFVQESTVIQQLIDISDVLDTSKSEHIPLNMFDICEKDIKDPEELSPILDLPCEYLARLSTVADKLDMQSYKQLQYTIKYKKQ